jgi:hypothetical protein
LRPLRGRSGGVLGGKALVAWHLASGLAVATATDPDGNTNEAKLVPDLLPQVRPHFQAVLWVGDRQFGDPTQAAAFTARAGDHFLVRYDGKTAFTPDPHRPVRRGRDSHGWVYEADRVSVGPVTLLLGCARPALAGSVRLPATGRVCLAWWACQTERAW